MSVGGEILEDYEEARSALGEGLTSPDGVLKCPECSNQALDWSVEGAAINALIVECEICRIADWAYFKKDPIWLEEF